MTHLMHRLLKSVPSRLLGICIISIGLLTFLFSIVIPNSQTHAFGNLLAFTTTTPTSPSTTQNDLFLFLPIIEQADPSEISPTPTVAPTMTVTTTPTPAETMSPTPIMTATVTMTPTPAETMSPQMPDDYAVSVATGNTFVADFDPTGESPISFSLSGTDAAAFSISSAGVLEFLTSPDYLDPTDANGDNVYLVTIMAQNSVGEDTTNLEVRVTDGSAVIADINPSRTECASPCTVVFSAEDTTSTGLDANQVWTQLSYYWDFDTDETAQYGSLYDQTYTYVAGDTSYEAGHVPLVTKTFLCEVGTCVYNVGLRAQNSAGSYGDVFQTITVNAESVQWSAADTICVSNTLDLNADWSNYDDPCPAGATKQSRLPLPDQFTNKLVLLKRGDLFDGADANDRIGILNGQSNFKVSDFGNPSDNPPELYANVYTSAPAYSETDGIVTSIDMRVQQQNPGLGETTNGYFENLRMASFEFPYMFQHVGLHNIDMDYEDDTNLSAGRISWPLGHLCAALPDIYDCEDFPFPKGAYISSVNVVGSQAAFEANAVNIVGISCIMSNFIGITDVSVKKAGEHNLRIMGWWRLSIMRSAFLGQHNLTVKQKVTTRACVSNELRSDSETYDKVAQRNDHYNDDIENRTRADIITKDGLYYYHTSRYQVTAYNVMGEAGPAQGTNPGGAQYQTNATDNENLFLNIILAYNTFIDEDEKSSGIGNASIQSDYGMCVGNNYSPNGGCGAGSDSIGTVIDPEPMPIPSPPSPP